MSDCLSDSKIALLNAGQLSDQAELAAHDHLQECPTCREALAGQSLFADLRRAVQLDVQLPLPNSETRDAAAEPMIAGSIEGYEILGEIHRGGQGVVYKAIQRATKRPVALKLLLQGCLATPEQRQRFEREIDLAASLRHAHIVTIYDSGVSQGRPYYAMEYIDGSPLNQYMMGQRPAAGLSPARAKRSQSAERTLQLFHQICQAVSFAHQRGVIHRDLKPENILIDKEGQPHLLDFGLAKRTDAILIERPALTLTGEFLGTLANASPEQTKSDPQLIDVRTDVYSLGVILYEMLTGSYPYDVSGSLSEVMHNICHVEPARLASTYAINDELETIVCKALAKEPERRYQTAEHLQRDVGHYLAGQPIDAKRDSNWYLLRKSLLRYRIAVSVAAGFVLVLAAALVISLVFWRRAISERDRAVVAEANTQRAYSERERAYREKDKAYAEKERERQNAEFHSYVANLAAADAAVQRYQIAEAVRYLGKAPQRHRNWEWHYLLGRVDRSQTTVDLGLQNVVAAVWTPDGARLVVGTHSGTVRILDARDQAEFATIQFSAAVSTLAVAPDSTRIAVGLSDASVHLLDMDGRPVAVFGTADLPVDVALSENGQFLAVATGWDHDDRCVVQVWDTASQRLLHTLSGEDHVYAVAFSPAGTVLAAGGVQLKLWDLATGNELATLGEHGNHIKAIRFTPDGTQIATASYDKLIKLWDVQRQSLRHTLSGHQSFVEQLAFSPDGSVLVSGSHDNTLLCWDTQSGTKVSRLWGHAFVPIGVSFDTDAAHVWSVSWIGRVKKWAIDDRNRPAASPARAVTSLAFSPDGLLLATGSDELTLRSAANGRLRKRLSTYPPIISALAFSPDGEQLVSAAEDRSIRLWDLTTFVSERIDSPAGVVQSLDFHPSAAQFVTGSEDKTVRLWDVAGHQLRVFTGHTEVVQAVSFNRDGRLIGSCDGRTIRIWATESGVLVKAWKYPEWSAGRLFLLFHPQQDQVLVPTPDSALTIWDAGTGELVAKLHHEHGIQSAAFSPDASRLVTSSRDRTVRLWDTHRQQPVLALREFSDYVEVLDFSPDGNRIAGGGYDGKLHIWSGIPTE